MKNYNLAGPGGIPALKQLPSDGSVTAPGTWVFPGNVTVNGTLTAAIEASNVITSSSANALAAGPNGATNPSFNVDASTASAATGLNIKSAAAGSGVAVSVISSGTNESMTIDAKGTGNITLQGTATGPVVINSRLALTGSQTSLIAAGRQGSTNPAIQVDSATASSVTGLKITAAAAAGGVALTAISSGTNESMTIGAKGTGTVTINSAVVAAAGGKAESGVMFGSIGVGVFTGTGAPTFSAMNGSIYVNSAATTTTTRIYVNNSGSGTAGTTWTNLTTAA